MKTVNDIKKILYKEKPTAKLIGEVGGTKHYLAETSIGGIGFQIPFEEGKDFQEQEPAQLLIRWIRTDGIKLPPAYSVPFNDKGQFIGTD